LFVEALDVDEMIAHLLIGEGFTKIEEIAFVELDELTSIEGFDADLATELQVRTKSYLEEKANHLTKRLKELKVAKDLQSLDGLEPDLLLSLAEKGLKTRDDLADLSEDEFLELVPADQVTRSKAQDLIMKARAHWFDEDNDETPTDS